MSNDQFRKAEDQFFLLKGQLAAGRITQAQFDAALKALMFRDAQGRSWMIGADTGKWYVHDGQNWVEQNPSMVSAAPPPSYAPSYAPAPSRGSNVTMLIAAGAIVVICLLGAIGLLLASNTGILKISLGSPPTPTFAPLPTLPIPPTVAPASVPTVQLLPTVVNPTVAAPSVTVTPTLSASDLIAQADALTYQSKFADAEALYQQVLLMDPANALGSAHWARALLIRGALEARGELVALAVTKAEIAAQVAPTNGEVAIWQARAYDWNGNHDKALIAAQKAVQLAPNSAQANAVLAEALANNGKSADADAAAQKTLQLDPNNADAHRIAGYLQYFKKEVQAAIAEFEKAAQIEPNLALRQYELGESYRLAKIYDKATDAYQKAIALYPNTARAYAGLGLAFLEQKQYDQAIANFTQATQINDTYSDAFYYLARANDMAGKCDQAIPAYKKTIELYPKSNYALTYLGWCLLKAGNLPAAADAAQKAAAIDPNYPDTKSLLAALAVAMATPTSPIPPGLYITAMGMDQAQPAHGQTVNFTVSFLNTGSGDFNVKWKVYIYRADTPKNPNLESAGVQATFPPGPTLNQAVPMNFRIGSTGNDCDYFYARVDTLDSNNKPTDLTTPDGKVFEKDFSVCK